jgi:hypothetical protein
MKSSYELAMERLSKSDSGSAKALSPQKREKLAEIDKVYMGKIAERDIFLRQRLNEALGGKDAEAVETIRRQISSEKARLEEEREAEKDRVRAS